MISKPDANKKSRDPLEDVPTLTTEVAELGNAATSAATQGIRSNYVASRLFHNVQAYQADVTPAFRASLAEQRKSVTAARAKLEDALRDVRVLEATLTELAGTPERAAAQPLEAA